MKHTLTLAVCALALILSPLGALAQTPEMGPTPEGAETLYTQNEVVVKWKKNVRDRSRAVRLNALNGEELEIRKENRKRGLSLVHSERFTTQELIERFEQLPTVEYVHENVIFRAQSQTVPWGVNNTNGVKARHVHTSDGFTGEGVVVAVIDTGVDRNHTDLDGNLWNAPSNTCTVDGSTKTNCSKNGWDFVGYNASGTNDTNPEDDNGHGTHVAGIIAAEDNSTGVIGVAPDAEIMAIKVLDADGAGSYLDVVSGIDFAIDNNADVINLSLGAINTGVVLKDLQDALDDAETAGVTVVAAAGNFSTNAQFSPAAFDTVVSVGAIQETSSGNNPDANYSSRLAYFSNYGKNNVVAPGMRINSTTFNGSTSGDTWNGTSMAAPYVAGVAALMLEKDSTLSPAKTRFILEDTATDLGNTGKDEFYGAGRVNAQDAMDALDSTTKDIVLEGNWAANSATVYATSYYLEPTIYSPTIPADGSTKATFRVNVRTNDGDIVSGETIDLTTTAGTLNASSVTTDSLGQATFTVTAPNTPGTATVEAEIRSTGATSSVLATFAETMLVSDAGQPYDLGNEAWYYRQSLEDAGEYWKQSPEAYAAWETTMDDYDKVVWHTSEYSLNRSEQTLIKNYLDDGGKIFTSGGDIAYTQYYYEQNGGNPSLDDDIVLTDYFKIAFHKYVASDLTVVGDGDFDGTGGELDDQGDNDDNSPFSDVVTAASGTSVGGYYCSNVEKNIVTVDAAYDSVFMGFAMEVMDKTPRDELVQNAIDFLDGSAQSGGTYSASSACDTAYNNDDGSGTDPSSAIDDDGPVPGTPAEATSDLDVSDEVLTDLTVSDIGAEDATITWTTSEDIDASIVYAKNTTTNETEATGDGSGTSVSVDELTPNTEYEFTVYGVYSDDRLTTASTITTSTVPAAPDVPAFKKRTRKSISLKLNDPNETGYAFRVQLRNKKRTKVIKTKTLDVGDTTVKFKGLKPGRTYNIRARLIATDDDGAEVKGEFSAYKKQRTVTDRVKKPTVTNKQRDRARLRYRKPKRGKIAQYRIQLRQRIDGKYKIIERYTVNKKLKKKKKKRWLKNLQPGTYYRVKVRAIFANGDKGRWSENRKFRTAE